MNNKNIVNRTLSRSSNAPITHDENRCVTLTTNTGDRSCYDQLLNDV